MPSYVSRTLKSQEMYQRAKKVLPAGVSYGVRYFEPYPFYTCSAKGSKLYDIDDNEYVDFWLGHTALILGHANPTVTKAVRNQLQNGTHYGTCHEQEIKLAEQVVKMVPNSDMIRFTNSGTEANMYVIRLARAYTGKNKIAKFEGGWHGGYDALQVSVKYPFNIPESAGLTEGATQDTLTLPFNDLDGIKKKLRNTEVACVLIEPVLGAGGGIPGEKDFLKGLRELCNEKDALLIFDEVITGFRLAPGGAQEYYDVKADLIVLGKILGGGFPIGGFCGSEDIMEKLNSVAHKRPEYSFHGGTFSANPISMTAGLSTLLQLEDGRISRRLNRAGEKLRRELSEIFEAHGIDVQLTGAGSIFNIHFTGTQVKDAIGAFTADRNRLVDYDLSMIEGGVFLLPTHNGVLCSRHSEDDLDKLLKKTEEYVHASSVSVG
jgi:glutamate-1-semialdehyde 2,1-aminomutase